MSAAIKKFLTTHEELTKLAGKEVVRFPATFDEYWELLKTAEFRADFQKNEIITISYENETHADIVTEILFLLKKIFPKSVNKHIVFNPNRPVYVNDCKGHAVFNPDGSVVPKPTELYEHSKGMNASINPILLFEVLSPSTSNYDFGTKLPCYKEIKSLQTIIYAETYEPKVIVIERLSKNEWKETIHTKKTDSFKVNGQSISLEEIYLNIHY